MEDVVPGIRIFTAGASFLLFLAVTLGPAAAQSTTAVPAGKPLPLLQFVHAKSKAKLPTHPSRAAKAARTKVKFARTRKTARKTVRRRIAKRIFAKPHKDIADARPTQAPTAATSPENVWPPADAAAPGGPAADTTAPNRMAGIAPNQAPAAVTTEQVTDTDPDQIMAGGHSVQTVLPNGLNHADLAAGDVKQAAKTTVANAVPPKPVFHAMVVKADADSVSSSSPIGSASWIAHVLAALGGALAAGVVAWFLISPAPGRTYG
jgi:hypothetical protein